MDSDSVFQLRDFGPPTQRPRQKSTLQRPNILPPRIRILSFSCRVISCPCFSASRTRTSLSRTRFAPFFFFLTLPFSYVSNYPRSGDHCLLEKEKKRKGKIGGIFRQNVQRELDHLLAVAQCSFLFSPPHKRLVPILCPPIRGRSPRPELRWCLVWAANLSTFGSSSREFELWFFLVCCLSFFFGSFMQRCPTTFWSWSSLPVTMIIFFLTSRKKSAVALSAPSLRFDFFGYFQLFGTHCRHDVNQPKNIKKKFKKSGTNWGSQSNAWFCQRIG